MNIYEKSGLAGLALALLGFVGMTTTVALGLPVLVPMLFLNLFVVAGAVGTVLYMKGYWS